MQEGRVDVGFGVCGALVAGWFPGRRGDARGDGCCEEVYDGACVGGEEASVDLGEDVAEGLLFRGERNGECLLE